MLSISIQIPFELGNKCGIIETSFDLSGIKKEFKEGKKAGLDTSQSYKGTCVKKYETFGK